MENEIIIHNEIDYKTWLVSIKNQIKSAQIKASIAVNEEMLNLYWNIGKDISEKHLDSQYGSGFFNNLSKDLKNDFPNSQGFSSRNLRYMKKFYDFYKNEILHQVGAELEDILFTIPWRHHIEIFTRSKSVHEALFFVQKSKENGWSRAMLINMMDTKLYETRGNTLNNFELTLPKEDSECAKEILKDEYKLDFVSLRENYEEKDLHHALEQNLIICKEKNDVVAQWTLENANEPIGISTYNLQNVLPSEKEIADKIGSFEK